MIDSAVEPEYVLPHPSSSRASAGCGSRGSQPIRERSHPHGGRRAHGGRRELQKLEQISAYTAPPYGLVSRVAYILTGQCGTGGIAYERGSFTDPAVLEMSLMPLPSGPPYSICDSYTFVTR